MANAADILKLRRLVSEPDTDTYSDEELNSRLDEDGDINITAGTIWREKASTYAELVDISEAGSSRKNSQLYKNALEMAASFDKASAEDSGTAPVDYPVTRAIVRA